MCSKEPKCAGFTFRDTPHSQFCTAAGCACFLKSKIPNGSPGDCVSGSSGNAPPPPPRPPGPPGPLLYNVESDPGERTPLPNSTANLKIIAELQAVVDKLAQTRVPQATGDPSCPPFSGLNTTHNGSVQLYIGPWCD